MRADKAWQSNGARKNTLTAHVLLDLDAAIRKTLVAGGVDGVDEGCNGHGRKKEKMEESEAKKLG